MNTEIITCTIDDAVRISGVSRSRLYQLLDDGKVTSTKIGNRRLIFVSSLRALLEKGHPNSVMPTPAKYAHKSASKT